MAIAGWTSAACRRIQAGARWHLSALFGVLIFTAVLAGYSENGAKPSQYEVEAVYLYDFGKFVRWPANLGSAPLQICIAGEDPFGKSLQAIVVNEQIDGHALAVRHIDRPKDTQGCLILFIDSSEKDHVDQLLAATAEDSVLTVSDAQGFLDHGGIVQFLLIENRVRFSVNLNAAKQHHLNLSSELLKVAVNVVGRPANGGVQ